MHIPSPQRGPSNPLPKFIWIPFLTIFLDLLGFGILIPIMPFFAKSFDAPASMIAMLGAVYSLMQFIFSPIWGRWSDRVGRRPIVLFSIAISFFGSLIFANATSFAMLALARALVGFGNANIAVAQAIVADITDNTNRGKGMGLIGVAFGLGFVIGPAIGGSLAQIDVTSPAIAAAVLAGINGILAYFYLPETLGYKESKTGKPERSSAVRTKFSLKELKTACSNPSVRMLFIWMFVATSAFAMMEHVLGLYIQDVWPGPTNSHAIGTDRFDNYKDAAAKTAMVLLCVGITAVIIQGGLIGRFINRFGEAKLIKNGTLLYAFALGIIPLSGYFNSFPLLLLISVLIALASGLTNPCVPSLLSQENKDEDQGGILGLGQSLSSLGRVVGPASTGFLFEVRNYLPFIVSASLMLVAWFFVSNLKNPQPLTTKLAE